MPEATRTDNFETFLIEHGFITQALYDQLEKDSQKTGEPVSRLLVSQKILSDQAMAQARAAFLNIPYIDFADRKVPNEYLELIPRDTEEFYRIFAFDKNGQSLKVAITDPTNLQALEAIEFFSRKHGFNIQLYVTDEQSFKKIVEKGDVNIERVVGRALKDIELKEKQEKKPEVKKETRSLDELIQDAPISQIVDVIMTNAIDSGASDIHIEPGENNLRVRYRIDGILKTMLVLPKNVQNAISSKVKILSNLKIDESRLPQDGRFHYNTEIKQVDLRVSILPNVNGEKIVMRILDKTTKVPTLTELGYRGKGLAWIEENMKKTHGIFLMTGPTGSGKSTTLYAVLSVLNRPTVNIITLEDPVEYFMEGVNQSQVNPDIGFTFATGLRSILRQDPNIIMVGEIRDKETAELAVHAALTGHLVFSTLHTNSAIGALPRLIDMGLEPFLLVASINGVGAQRLCRKICNDCKREIQVPEPLKKEMLEGLQGVQPDELSEVDVKNIKLYAGKGCNKCNDTGYKGRVAITEVMPVTPRIQDIVLSKGSSLQIFEEAQKIGMITMKQDGIIKSLMGVTTYEEVVRVTSE